MNRADHIRLMASYNEWMNTKLYDVAKSLHAEELIADKKAFFRSILGTLNHVAVGDTIWLKRFANHPAGYAALEPVKSLPSPSSLDQILFADMQGLSDYRKTLDRMITEWAQSIQEEDLDHVLSYVTTTGLLSRRHFFSLAMHFFNHQTHHRGQATTLLSQAGADVGETDLFALIPNEA